MSVGGYDKFVGCGPDDVVRCLDGMLTMPVAGRSPEFYEDGSVRCAGQYGPYPTTCYDNKASDVEGQMGPDPSPPEVDHDAKPLGKAWRGRAKIAFVCPIRLLAACDRLPVAKPTEILIL